MSRGITAPGTAPDGRRCATKALPVRGAKYPEIPHDPGGQPNLRNWHAAATALRHGAADYPFPAALTALAVLAVEACVCAIMCSAINWAEKRLIVSESVMIDWVLFCAL